MIVVLMLNWNFHYLANEIICYHLFVLLLSFFYECTSNLLKNKWIKLNPKGSDIKYNHQTLSMLNWLYMLVVGRAYFAHEHFLKYCKMRERGFRKLPHNLFPRFKGCAMNYRMTYKNSNLEYIKTCFLSSFRKNL